MDLDINLDSDKPLDFHDLMLAGVQDDERAPRAPEARNTEQRVAELRRLAGAS